MASTPSPGDAAPQAQAMQAREAAPPPTSYQHLSTPPASGFAPGVLPPGAVLVTHPQGMAGNAYAAYQLPQQPAGGNQWASSASVWTADGESCWWSLWCPALLFPRTVARFDLVKSPFLFFCLLMGVVVICGAGTTLIAFYEFFALLDMSSELPPATFALVAFLIFMTLAACRTYYRGKIRSALGITGDCFEDLCLHIFCSPCAIAQEARQANVVHRPVKEFVTGDVLPALSEDPTATGDLSFFATLRRASRFSFLLLTSLSLFFALLVGIVIANRGYGDLSPKYVLHAIFTLLQPLVVFYLVYWRQHRKEASLDVVIKLFATGLFFTYPSTTLIKQIGEQPINAFWGFDGSILDFSSGSNSEEYVRQSIPSRMSSVIIVAFFLVFAVAAVWEEVFKYFILRHCMLGGPVRSPHTILIYLISGALGFACAENLIIFFRLIYPANGWQAMYSTQYYSQDTVLALSALMPVHVICAALQANQWVKTAAANQPVTPWRVVLPGYFLNGIFKFVLMVLAAVLWGKRVDEKAADATSAIIGFAVTFVGLFVAYRLWCAQQERLHTAGMLPGAVEIANEETQGGSGEVAMVMHSGFDQDRNQAASAKSADSIYPQGGAIEAELVVVTPMLHVREGGAEVV